MCVCVCLCVPIPLLLLLSARGFGRFYFSGWFVHLIYETIVCLSRVHLGRHDWPLSTGIQCIYSPIVGALW